MHYVFTKPASGKENPLPVKYKMADSDKIFSR